MEGPVRDQAVYQSKWLQQRETKEEVRARYQNLLEQNRAENNRRLVEVEQAAIQKLGE
jgi:hypothetical protein